MLITVVGSLAASLLACVVLEVAQMRAAAALAERTGHRKRQSSAGAQRLGPVLGRRGSCCCHSLLRAACCCLLLLLLLLLDAE